MTEQMQVYKCEHCGIAVEVIHGGASKLICCGEPMKLYVENTVDASKEKHVPVVAKVDGGIKINVGSIAHPMEDTHYIEWVEVIVGNKSCRNFFKPGDAPEVVLNCVAEAITVRAFCNLHGLWTA